MCSCMSKIQATKDEINGKYRHLSRLFHPDKHSGEEINQAAANSFFNKIKKAHEGKIWI